ncbi:MAG: hypothetical protein D6762_08095 [Candidatus Neomarinimicrobiota bacterium]|nr:MAG: hypothetical protein D6762_08095 [Candidatus Neomarinimicrobiota bacterium]
MTVGQWILQLDRWDYLQLGVYTVANYFLLYRFFRKTRDEMLRKNPYTGLSIPGPAVIFTLAALLTAVEYLLLNPWFRSLLDA